WTPAAFKHALNFLRLEVLPSLRRAVQAQRLPRRLLEARPKADWCGDVTGVKSILEQRPHALNLIAESDGAHRLGHLRAVGFKIRRAKVRPRAIPAEQVENTLAGAMRPFLPVNPMEFIEGALAELAGVEQVSFVGQECVDELLDGEHVSRIERPA